MWLYKYFDNNIYATKDYTYHNLHGRIQNKDIAVLKGDKNSSVVTMLLKEIYYR